jgi:hypothetical protein
MCPTSCPFSKKPSLRSISFWYKATRNSVQPNDPGCPEFTVHVPLEECLFLLGEESFNCCVFHFLCKRTYMKFAILFRKTNEFQFTSSVEVATFYL